MLLTICGHTVSNLVEVGHRRRGAGRVGRRHRRHPVGHGVGRAVDTPGSAEGRVPEPSGQQVAGGLGQLVFVVHARGDGPLGVLVGRGQVGSSRQGWHQNQPLGS